MHFLIIAILTCTLLQTSDFPNCKTSNYKDVFISSIENYNKLLVSKFPNRETNKKDVFVSSSFLFYEQLLLVVIPQEGDTQIASVINFLQLPHDDNGLDCYTDSAIYFNNHIEQQQIQHKGLVYINPNVALSSIEKDKQFRVVPKKLELFKKIAETQECDLAEKKTELENIIKYKTHNMLCIETIESMVTSITFSIYIMLLGMHFTLNQFPETPTFKPISVEYQKGGKDKVQKDVLEAKEEFYTYKDKTFFVVFVDIYIKVKDSAIAVNEKTKMVFVAKHEHLEDKSKEHFLEHLGQLDLKSIYNICLDNSNNQCVKKKMDLRIPVINELYVKDFYTGVMMQSGMESLFNAYSFTEYIEDRQLLLMSDGVGILTKMFLNKEGEAKVALLSMEASDFKLEEVIPQGFAHSMFVSVYDTELGLSYLELLMYKDHSLKGPRLILDMQESYMNKASKHKHLLFLLVIGFVTFVAIAFIVYKKRGKGGRRSMRSKINERGSLLISDKNEDAFV